jgi:23S rRNA-/tRNA-specific pseudouridylate synthase
MRKEYVALVEGVFAHPSISVSAPISALGRHDGGICTVDEREGKPSLSTFELIWSNSDSNTSLVRCFPHTGRTHQLRVHLLHLGHGIVGDPLYNNQEKAAGKVLDSLGQTKEDYQRGGTSLCEECGGLISFFCF